MGLKDQAGRHGAVWARDGQSLRWDGGWMWGEGHWFEEVKIVRT